MLTVAFTDTGKPYFVDSDIHFSISHSKGVCAVAVSDQPVGVDVEVIKDSYNPHLIERSLNEKEKVTFDGDFCRGRRKLRNLCPIEIPVSCAIKQYPRRSGEKSVYS